MPRLPLPSLALLKLYKRSQRGETTPIEDARLRKHAAKIGHDMRSLDNYTTTPADPAIWPGGERVIHRDDEEG